MMDMKTVRSLASHIVTLGMPTEKLFDFLVIAESGNLQAIAVAVDKGITLEELCEGFRMAIDEKQKAN